MKVSQPIRKVIDRDWMSRVSSFVLFALQLPRNFEKESNATHLFELLNFAIRILALIFQDIRQSRKVTDAEDHVPHESPIRYHSGTRESSGRTFRCHLRETHVFIITNIILEKAVEPAEHAKHAEREGLRQTKDFIRLVKPVIGITHSHYLRYSASSAGN